MGQEPRYDCERPPPTQGQPIGHPNESWNDHHHCLNTSQPPRRVPPPKTTTSRTSTCRMSTKTPIATAARARDASASRTLSMFFLRHYCRIITRRHLTNVGWVTFLVTFFPTLATAQGARVSNSRYEPGTIFYRFQVLLHHWQLLLKVSNQHSHHQATPAITTFTMTPYVATSPPAGHTTITPTVGLET